MAGQVWRGEFGKAKMTKYIKVNMSVEETRDRFVLEMVHRKGGTVGLEMNLAGHADARRRFVLAIQGWEKTLWIRPLVTRIEGWFQRTEANEETYVYFVRRGLTAPLFFLLLLVPYTVTRALIENLPLVFSDYVLIAASFGFVIISTLILMFLERRTHKLLIDGLRAIYDQAEVEKS